MTTLPPVTRLASCASRMSQGTASRAPGYAVPDASGIAASTTEEHLCVSHTRCALLRRLPPRVAVSQRNGAAVRGKWASPIQHNRALFEVPPVVRCALLVSSPLRFACALRVRITSGYVLRPYRLPHARCCHACSKDSRCARAGKATGTSTFVWSRAARRRGVCGLSPAHPAVTVARLALRCSFPRARARSRPPPLGAPLKVKSERPNTSTGALRAPECR